MKQIPRFIAPMTFSDVYTSFFKKVDQEKFQQIFANFIGSEKAVIAPSGRFAFGAILKAFDFPKGGEVVLPALTFHSIPQMIRDAGLNPVFVDIIPGAYCIDHEKIEEAINEKTVAVLPTHLYGRACDMDAIIDIAKVKNLKVIEDCAQACGGYWKGKRVGSIGDAAFFSFGPTKNLAMLWAGMITTNDPKIAEKATSYTSGLPKMGFFELINRLINALAMRMVTNPFFWQIVMAPLLRLFAKHGTDPIEKMTEETPGKKQKTNLKAQSMPHQFQVEIGVKQLKKLDDSNKKRVINGNYLIDGLKGIENLILPKAAKNDENIFMSFPVLVEDRDTFRKKLLLKGVDCAIGYMNVCPGMEDSDRVKKVAPNALFAVDGMVHLPVYPELEKMDKDIIIKQIKEALETSS